MPTINWGVRIDLTDNNTDTNAAIGLYSGYFNWITGRPGYAGSGYSGEAPASQTWKQGVITSIDKMSPAVRIIPNIEVSGDYGSLSGFSIEIDNTSLFWNTLDTNDYYMLNRDIDVYIFLDDVSYHVWGGKISGVEFNITSYIINCGDDQRTVHKIIPQNTLSDTNFPDIAEKAVGSVIPICFGNVKYAQFVPIYTDNEPLVLSNVEDAKTIAGAESIDASAKTLTLYTSGVDNFGAGELKGAFVRAVVNGSNQSIEIINNDQTSIFGDSRLNTTKLYLASWFDSTPVVIGSSPFTNTDFDIWYFEIIRFNATHIVSQGSIDSWITDDSGNPVNLSYWDKDDEDYIDTSEILKEASLTNIKTTTHPGIRVTSKTINLQGDLTKIFTTIIDEIRYQVIQQNNNTTQSSTFPTTPDDCENLHDEDDTTSYNTVYRSSAGTPTQITFAIELKCKVPEPLLNANYENAYLLLDFAITSVQATTSFSINYSLLANDYMQRETSTIKQKVDWFDDAAGTGLDANLSAGVEREYDLIPRIYYNEFGADDSDFYDKKDDVEPDNFLANNKVINAYPWLRLWLTLISITAAANNDITLEIKEVALIGEKTINVIDQNIYTKLKGESV